MTEEEKLKIFKELLEDLGVSATWRWDDVVRALGTSQDRRRNAFPTMQRKKQVFQEYLGECKRRDRELKNEKKLQHRDNFVKLLDEHHFPVDSHFCDVALMVGADPRFKTID